MKYAKKNKNTEVKDWQGMAGSRFKREKGWNMRPSLA
jgi:hypothetical protein